MCVCVGVYVCVCDERVCDERGLCLYLPLHHASGHAGSRDEAPSLPRLSLRDHAIASQRGGVRGGREGGVRERKRGREGGEGGRG